MPMGKAMKLSTAAVLILALSGCIHRVGAQTQGLTSLTMNPTAAGVPGTVTFIDPSSIALKAGQIFAFSGTNMVFPEGAYWNGSAWVAQQSNATIMSQNGANTIWYSNAGLTPPSGTFSPTIVMELGSGNLTLEVPPTFNGIASFNDGATMANLINVDMTISQVGSSSLDLLDINTASGSGGNLLSVNPTGGGAIKAGASLYLDYYTAATSSSGNYSSPDLWLGGTYWNGSTSSGDDFECQDVLGTGSAPTATLNCTHSGTTGTVGVNLPGNLYVSGNITCGGSCGGGGIGYPSGTGFVTVTGGAAWGTAVGSTGSGNVVLASAPTIANLTVTGSCTGCGGGGSPGGSNADIQVNSSGSFAGYASLTWVTSTNTLGATNASIGINTSSSSSISYIDPSNSALLTGMDLNYSGTVLDRVEGAYWNGSDWIAQQTNAAIFSLSGSTVNIFADSSLTPSSSYSPSLVLSVEPATTVYPSTTTEALVPGPATPIASMGLGAYQHEWNASWIQNMWAYALGLGQQYTNGTTCLTSGTPCSGELQIGSGTTIQMGAATSNTPAANVSGNLIPATTNTGSIGTGTYTWGNGFFQDLTISNIEANFAIAPVCTATYVGGTITNCDSYIQTFNSSYISFSSPQTDYWTESVLLAPGVSNPTSTLAFAHSGSSGMAAVSVPDIQVTNTPTVSSSCGITSSLGNDNWGTFVITNSCSGSTVITFSKPAPNGWSCSATNNVLAGNGPETAYTTTTATISTPASPGNQWTYVCGQF